MLGMLIRENLGITLLNTLTTLPFVSTVASPICYRIVSVIAMKLRSRATGKRIWTRSLTALPVMEGARSGPAVVVAMDPIGAMDLGFK